MQAALLAFCFFAVVSVAACGQASLEEGLVAHWRFNEGEGDIVFSESGTEFAGTAYGITWIDGVDGTALDFRGVEQAYVEVPHTDALNPTTGLSLSVWVRFAKTDERVQPILTKTYRTVNAGYVLRAREDGRVVFKLYDGESLHLVLGGMLVEGEWMHVVATWDGRFMRIYVQGELVTLTPTEFDGPVMGTEKALNIGRYVDYASQFYWAGGIDELRIYSRALTEEEIQALYGAVSEL